MKSESILHFIAHNLEAHICGERMCRIEERKIDRLERKYEFMGLRKLFEVSLIIKDCHRDDKN